MFNNILKMKFILVLPRTCGKKVFKESQVKITIENGSTVSITLGVEFYKVSF